MFEVYLDERHCVTFNTAHRPDDHARMTGTLRPLVNGGHAKFTGLRAWEMNPEKRA